MDRYEAELKGRREASMAMNSRLLLVLCLIELVIFSLCLGVVIVATGVSILLNDLTNFVFSIIVLILLLAGIVFLAKSGVGYFKEIRRAKLEYERWLLGRLRKAEGRK